MSRFALSIVLFFAGCSGGPFSSLSPGVYECTADVLLNTCEIDIASSSRRVEFATGSQILAYTAPGTFSSSGGFASPPWQQNQFGHPPNPFERRWSESQSCTERSSFRSELSSHITRLAGDALELEHEIHFEDVARCGMSVDSCTLRYAIRCVRAVGI
jgi:hypothetical protein